MTTDPNTIAGNGRRLLDALEAWPTAADNSAVLAACAAVRGANDPADRLSRAECALADAVQRAVVLNDPGAFQDLRDELQHSSAVMHEANVAAFQGMLRQLDFDTVTAAKIDQLAAIGRELNRQAG